jgi:signal peptidase I
VNHIARFAPSLSRDHPLTTTTIPSAPPREEVNVFSFRQTARRRAMLCPGAGFDYMRQSTLAVLSYGASVATLLFAIGTAYAPSKALLVSTILLVVAGTVLWGWEIFATLTAWPTAEPHRVKLNPWWGMAGIVALMIVFGLVTFNAFKLATFDGLHMSTTIGDEETILFHRFVDDEQLQRGAVVLFTLPEENKVAEPGKLTLGRIIAVPGDTIQTVVEPNSSDARYKINDVVARMVAPSGSLPIAIRVPKSGKLTVPPGCYFVAQDSKTEGFDSRVLGYAKRDRIVSAKMFRWNKTPFLETIK